MTVTTLLASLYLLAVKTSPLSLVVAKGAVHSEQEMGMVAPRSQAESSVTVTSFSYFHVKVWTCKVLYFFPPTIAL